MTSEEIVDRCRWAIARNHGHPSSTWPTGEQLAVALVLRDRAHLNAMRYTVEQANELVRDGARLSGIELTGWLADIRARVRSGQPAGG